MQQKVHEDQRYIKGIAENNNLVINEIYKKFVPKVVHHIKTNSGNEDDAYDVIQEVMITLYTQASVNKLELTCPFDAYFFLLCKRKWINELNKSSTKKVTLVDDFVSIDKKIQDEVNQTEHFDSKKNLFDTMFEKLGEKCKELLKLSFELDSLDEVAQKLNVTYGYVRKKKSLCTGELTEMIQQTDAYKQLK
jgi:RNA polymerase sigma factor (sigma-70 family)